MLRWLRRLGSVSQIVKIITLLILFLAVTVGSLRADFFSPFADSKVGATVKSDGQIVVVERKRGGADYFVHCRACTGPVDIAAEIPASLIQPGMAGRNAMITATIREREDSQTKSKTRFLEITAIEFLK